MTIRLCCRLSSRRFFLCGVLMLRCGVMTRWTGGRRVFWPLSRRMCAMAVSSLGGMVRRSGGWGHFSMAGCRVGRV